MGSPPVLKRLTKSVRTTVKGWARCLGYDIRKLGEQEVSLGLEVNRRAFLLKAHGVDLVFDVGANTGQFAMELQEQGFNHDIVSFEPVPSAYQALCENQKRSLRPNWRICEQMALGDRDGTVEVNVSEISVCSSILPIMQSHIDAMPGSRVVHQEKVQMRMLDSVADAYLATRKRPFLKLDVQGFEDAVLAGATKTLEKIVGIQIEVSFVPLYEGGGSFIELYKKLTDLGFVVQDVTPGFVDVRSNALLQADFIFFKLDDSTFKTN